MEDPSDRRSRGEAGVRIHVDLANTVTDALLDCFNRDPAGVGHLAPVPIDCIDQFGRHARRSMHHYPDIRHQGVDLLHKVDREGRRILELVCAMRCPDRNGQCVDTGALNKDRRLFRVGEDHAAGLYVFLDTAQGAKFAFHRDAVGMRHLYGTPSDVYVAVETARGLPIWFKRTVQHDRREPEVDGRPDHVQLVPMVEMQGDFEVWVLLNRRFHQLLEVDQVGVPQGTFGGLDDDRGVGLTRCAHDSLDLLHVVDVERADAIATALGLVKDLLHWYE